MFKIKKKILIYSIILCFLLIFISASITCLKTPFLNTLKQPLNLLTLCGRELKGIIFYHRNFIQNEKLKKEIDLLRNKLNLQAEIYQENTRLKDLLSFKQKSPYKVIASRVISRSPDSWSSSIIIDKGKHSGIKPGMVAITHLGLVGRVMETQTFTSKIILISDPSLGVSSIVQRSRQEGLVSGTLGNHLIMRYLPEGSDIRIQDVIITSGLNDTYPKGLLIGTVIDVGREFSGLSHYCFIKPAVKLSNLEEVLIIIP